MTDVLVPDMGSDDPVDLAEILVKVGDRVELEDSLVVLESAKASLEVPAPSAGVVSAIHVAAGQSLNAGDLLLTLTATTTSHKAKVDAPASEAKSEPEFKPAAKPIIASQYDSVSHDADQEYNLPDIGGDAADIIELSLQAGAKVKKDQTIMVLESAKATVEVPAPAEGVLVKYLLKVGDSVTEGTPYVILTTMAASDQLKQVVKESNSDSKPQNPSSNSAEPKNTTSIQTLAEPAHTETTTTTTTTRQPVSTTPNPAHLDVNTSTDVHAGPAVRRLSNKLGVALNLVVPSGPRGRILKEDVHAFVKVQMQKPRATESGSGLPALPSMDFAQFGEVEEVALTKIQHMSAQNLHRAWVNIPHVTQFDEADITELEAFRKSLGDEYKAKGIKITMLAFLVKASTLALKAFPRFNASLHSDGKTLIQKKYCNIGFAADTPFGLVVPVIRDADQLSVVSIAGQLAALSSMARDKKLGPKDMQGGCFSVSSLGGIGGTAFTPIVNWPEVAILGVSRASMQPRWNGQTFEPRLMLPLSLSYDHRVIDGADAARFAQYLVQLLSDARRMLL